MRRLTRRSESPSTHGSTIGIMGTAAVLAITSLSGCASTKSSVPPATVYVPQYVTLKACPEKPSRPSLKFLADSHLGSAQNAFNIDALLDPISAYVERLEEIIACYEQQVNSKENHDEKR